MKKLLMSCGLIFLCASYASAMPKQVASSGFFVTGDAGYGYLFTPGSDISSGGSYQRGNLAWSAGVGYNWALDSFNLAGLEVDYLDNGKSTYNSGSVGGGPLKITSQSAAILLSYTTIWENGINLFFKAGPVYVRQKNDFSSPTYVNGVLMSGSDTKTGFSGMGELGVGYYLAHNLNLFVDATYLFGHTNSNWNNIAPGNTPSNISLAASAQVKLGLSYQF